MKNTDSINAKIDGSGFADIPDTQISMFDYNPMVKPQDIFFWEVQPDKKVVLRTKLSNDEEDVWNYESILNNVHPRDTDKVTELLDHERKGNYRINMDVRLNHFGSYRSYKVKGRAYYTDEVGGSYANGIAYDISRLKEHMQRLQFLENHDYLTGLKNMDAFDTLYEQISKYNMYPQALVLANIDQLKEINDTLGYRAGNTLIKNVAYVIEECFYDADLIARIGGGEFCALFSGINADEIAMKIKEAGMMLHKMYLNLIKTEVTFGHAFSYEQQEFSAHYRNAMDNMQKNKTVKRFLSDVSVIDDIDRMISHKAGWGKRAMRLQSMAVQIAMKLGVSDDYLDEIRVLAKIADIGLIGLDDRLIAHRKMLRGKDRMEYFKHIEHGRSLIMSIDGLAVMEPMYLDIFKRYDEWKDGISVSSRIVAGATAFDDIVSGVEDVAYEDIQKALGRQKGLTHCPAVVDAILDIIGRHYVHNYEKEMQ